MSVLFFEPDVPRFQKIYYFFPSIWSKISIGEQPATSFSIVFPQKDHIILKVSLTEKGNTQNTPKRENNKFHNPLVLTQWIRMWSMNSSSDWQRKHLFAKHHPLLLKSSKVKTFAQVASHAKKLTFGGTQEFQITLAENNTVLLDSKVEKKTLTVNFPFFWPCTNHLIFLFPANTPS